MDDSVALVQVYGSYGSRDAWQIRDFLSRSVVHFIWHELRNDMDALRATGEMLSSSRLPLVVLPDQTRLYAPTVQQIAMQLGWIKAPRQERYDLSIFGAGPAGLSAAVYAASEGLSVVLVEREAVGGQAGSSSLIENYLGFPDGLPGAMLAERARQQATKFGAELLLMRRGVMSVFDDDGITATLEDGSQIRAHANICATGIGWRRLNVPGENELLGQGVYYGAGTSEASHCFGEHVVVIGGGNSAGQAVMNLASYASTVTMVIRGASLAATLSEYLADRVQTQPNVRIRYNTTVEQFHGNDVLEAVSVTDGSEQVCVPAQRAFVCIGGEPDTDWAADTALQRDDAGYLRTGPDLLPAQLREVWPLDREPYHLETSVPGSFAAGDVRHRSVKRVATAVGEGAMAVTFAHHFLHDKFGR
jgi:thioredoxin reductase (NADPH)